MQVELWSAFARRQRDGSLSPTDYEQTIAWFTEHRHSLYRLVPINDAVLQKACTLIEKHPLRGADAIHLATAIILNKQLAATGAPLLTFLSSDTRLNSAARAAGLTVDDPNDHP